MFSANRSRMRWTTVVSLPLCVCSVLACGLPIDDFVERVAERVHNTAERCEPRATTRLSIRLTLDASVHEVRTWDAANPPATSQFSHGSTVYSADGEPFELDFYYTFQGTRLWQWHVIPAEDVYEVGIGELEFDEAGRLVRSTVIEPLRLVEADNTRGTPITVDYGPLASGDPDEPTTQTSLSTSLRAIHLEADGQPAVADPDCR